MMLLQFAYYKIYNGFRIFNNLDHPRTMGSRIGKNTFTKYLFRLSPTYGVLFVKNTELDKHV